MILRKFAGRMATALAILGAALPGRAGAETVTYQVTFESTWSAATHPTSFPSNAHFSGLIGGTHTAAVSFWNAGALASTGIKDMAELGSKTALMQEVQTAITAGTANAVLSGGGISPSPGTVSMTFDVDAAYPLVTLVSMLAPSPDWFVGVTGLNLHPNGAWVSSVTVPLVVHDAGTDSGPTYAAPNQVTSPPVPIAPIVDGLFASNNVVGTFKFVRTALLGVPERPPVTSGQLRSLGPNPVRQATAFEILVPNGGTGDLAVFAISGQRVRGLFHGETTGGARTVTWDARDDRGARVPAGVYFVALRGTGFRPLTTRIAVTR